MITVLGSINLDLVATPERLPEPGETVPGRDFTTSAGGKGANQALAVLRAGAAMRLAGAVGNDAFAAGALAELEKDKADLGHVARLDGATGVAVILVDAQGENVIVVVPGANGKVDAEMAEAAVAAMQPGDHLMLQQEIPAATIAAALKAAKAKGIITLLNIAPLIPETEELAALADIVVANETEFARLTGTPLDPAAPEQPVADYAKANGQSIIVTLGADGAVAAAPGGSVTWVPAPEIEPVDTVGAGDTFCGYLAAGLDSGMSLEQALHRAVVAGALACLKPGAQPAIPYAEEVEAAGRNFSR